MKKEFVGHMPWGLRGEQMEFCLEKESISWTKGGTDKILFLEGKYGQAEGILSQGGSISWLEGRADKIMDRWHCVLAHIDLDSEHNLWMISRGRQDLVLETKAANIHD
eukprot:11254574-Ditylum_brightwellii.AAC.1